MDIVYADSLTPVAAARFRYTGSREYPRAVDDFAKSFEVIEGLPCDILLTPHPDATGLWEKLTTRAAGVTPDPLIDPTACRRYAAAGRQRLATRLADERK